MDRGEIPMVDLVDLDALSLADYRRNVFGMYYKVRRSGSSPEERWRRFCQERDRLFKQHPQSALTPAQRAGFTGLRYYPYNPALRFQLPIEPQAEAAGVQVDLQADG